MTLVGFASQTLWGSKVRAVKLMVLRLGVQSRAVSLRRRRDDDGAAGQLLVGCFWLFMARVDILAAFFSAAYYCLNLILALRL